MTSKCFRAFGLFVAAALVAVSVNTASAEPSLQQAIADSVHEGVLRNVIAQATAAAGDQYSHEAGAEMSLVHLEFESTCDDCYASLTNDAGLYGGYCSGYSCSVKVREKSGNSQSSSEYQYAGISASWHVDGDMPVPFHEVEVEKDGLSIGQMWCNVTEGGVLTKDSNSNNRVDINTGLRGKGRKQNWQSDTQRTERDASMTGIVFPPGTVYVGARIAHVKSRSSGNRIKGQKG